MSFKRSNTILDWSKLFWMHPNFGPDKKFSLQNFFFSTISKIVSEPLNEKAYFLLYFIYSEKATKFCEIFTLLLNVCTVVKSKVKISQNFTKNLPKFCGLLRINELYNIHKKKMVLGILKKVDLVFFFTLPVQ